MADVKQQQAIEQYRRFLEMQTDNQKMRAEATRRLGDLQVEVDEIARAGAETALSGAELSEAVKLYEGLLAAQPDYERNDAVSGLKAEIRKAKALEWLLRHVEIVDTEGAAIDRDLLLPPEEDIVVPGEVDLGPDDHDHSDHDHNHDHGSHDHDHGGHDHPHQTEEAERP